MTTPAMSVLWLRRDLRRHDHPALCSAAQEGRVAVLFVLDPEFFDPAGPVRQAWLAHTLRATAAAYDGRLCLRIGDPRQVVPRFAAEVGARTVHVSAETEPAGAQRDAEVRAGLTEAGLDWVATGSPYAVSPGRVRSPGGQPYRVFTPFSRAWRSHGWRSPAEPDRTPMFVQVESDDRGWNKLEAAMDEPGLPAMPDAGEEAALHRWRTFLSEGLPAYAKLRDRPDYDGTSKLSPYLKFGVLHPRTLLADIAGVPDSSSERFIAELAWREFYADVLFHQPQSLWSDLTPALQQMGYDADEESVQRWKDGTTGFPIVDAGMRQLLGCGWMHNRVRMITASFLCKDLHAWWPTGARHFLDHLIDGDLASNNHGWQWVAGTGTDPAPYFRVFNPMIQGPKFDPRGDYVRTWIPELRHLKGADVHEPWRHSDGYAGGYPERIVDHAAERRVALGRYERARA